MSERSFETKRFCYEIDAIDLIAKIKVITNGQEGREIKSIRDL